jgi:hypothetical protein
MLIYSDVVKELLDFANKNAILTYHFEDLDDWGLALFCEDHKCYLGLYKDDNWKKAIISYESRFAKKNKYKQLSLF